MRRLFLCLTGLTLALSLTGCSAAAFFLCGDLEADLVVVNDSGWAVYSIVLEYADRTEGVQTAGGSALLERGQSYGLELEEGAERVTVTLSGKSGRELARRTVDFAGERLYLTLEQNGSLSVSEEWTNG